MTKYLLLRDNKESGPYTFEDIRTKGLKAYDLVWVEGRSAAWRYPCEIEELSAFAPAVEEQPFDRFYKKPSQNQTVSSATPIVSTQEPIVATLVPNDHSTLPGKRIIYVTMPAANTTAPVQRTIASPPPAPAVHEKYLPGPATPVATAPVVEENYAQAQMDWKNDVEIVPRIQKKNNLNHIGRTMAIGFGVLILLIAGIFIGMSINKDSLGWTKELAFWKTAQPVPPVTHPPVTLAVSHPTPPPVQQVAVTTDTTTTATASVAAQEAPPTSMVVTPIAHKEKTAKKELPTANTAVAKDSAVQTAPAVRREATHRTDVAVEKVDKEVVRNNLANLVSLGANAYTVGAFGGISDLQLTVSNHSVYPLDLVVVQIQYIQSNKKVFKTETISFRGIPAGSALMQEAPRSTRGIKVEYKVTQVISKEPGLSYSAL